MKLIKQIFVGLFSLLLLSLPAHAVTTVTIAGTWFNGYANPCVYCHVDIYALNPTIFSGGNGTIVSNTPLQFTTDTSGNFSATVTGGITAALYFEETGGILKAALPASGTVTLAQIQAQQPNVVSAFPPIGNLPMGGAHFTGMNGGQAIGDSVAVGLGLDSEQIQSASGTLSFPTGATYAEVLLRGAGGGGGGGNTGASNGGGGGSGGTVARCLLWASNGPLTVTLGAAGVGGGAGADGTDGGDTIVGAAGLAGGCTAPGGKKGTTGSGGGVGTGGAAPGNATATGAGQILFFTVGTAGANGTAGAGGSGGGNGQFGGNGGNPGGSGPLNAGANGAIGFVIVRFY